VSFTLLGQAPADPQTTPNAPTAVRRRDPDFVDPHPVYMPMTGKERLRWTFLGAISMRRIGGNALTSALSTNANSPHEYGPHWDGFAKRLLMRTANGATQRVIEASFGSLWGEDPRYVRATGMPLKSRFGNIFKMSFTARNRQGETIPAYARYIAISSNSYLTNAWRPDSQASATDAAMRIPVSFLNRIISNTVNEFWPDMMRPFR
jgi:hypothetical protein